MAAYGVPQQPERQLPVRLRLFAVLGQGEGAPQRLVHRGRTGEQGVRHGCAVGLALPADLPAGLLEAVLGDSVGAAAGVAAGAAAG